MFWKGSCSHVLRRLLLLVAVACLLSFVACSSDDDDDEAYPSIITEMAMAYADAQGLLARIVNDAGQSYVVVNEVKGMKANETLRVLVGYVVEETGRVRVYTAHSIPILADASKQEKRAYDPVGIESAWLGGGYLNLHLLPKTRGGKQAWAFLRDSTSTNSLGGTTYHLSLFHAQLQDSTAYSTHFYTCVSLDSIASSFADTDSLIFTVFTFGGPRQWQYKP